MIPRLESEHDWHLRANALPASSLYRVCRYAGCSVWEAVRVVVAHKWWQRRRP
jgi:hypothetical protein